MWIVKNETAASIALPELKLEIAAKEYVDLDAHGRKKAEQAPSVVTSLARGGLRTITKGAAEEATSAKKPAASSAPSLLKDLVEHPPTARSKPLLIPVGDPTGQEGETVVGVKESFRRLTQKRRQEDTEPAPEMAALRKELERFRQQLLGDIHKLLEDYLRP